MSSRRNVLIAGLATVLVGWSHEADARPRRRGLGVARPPRRRRVVRRRVRRRHRRRVVRRVVGGRDVYVVPVKAAVGWELVVNDTVYVVTKVERLGETERFTLAPPSGAPLVVDVVRSDDEINSQELQGSELPESDTETPGVTTEVEEEVDD